MKFLHYLIILPLLAAAAWIVYNADSSAEGISFLPWPQDCVDTKLVLIVFLLYGYIIGRIGAWFSYSPIRSDLRRQKKANKVLNIEQAKLNETVTGLKQDIVGLQEKAKQGNLTSVNAEKNDVQAWWNGFKQKISPKKGN